MKIKEYIVRDGYIGVYQYKDYYGFYIYRFPGGDTVADDSEIRNGFDDRESAEKYAMENYGHAN